MDVFVARVFRVTLMVFCDLSASSMTKSCTDAPIEANLKAGDLVYNQSKKSFGACIVYADLFYFT